MLRATLLTVCVAATCGKRAGNTLMPQREEDKSTTLVQFTNPSAEAIKALTAAPRDSSSTAAGPDEDPLPQRKNLRGMQGIQDDAIYTDPRKMEKHMRAVDPRLNASLVKEETKDPIAFQKWCEEEFKAGSRVTDYANFKYDGPTSNRTVVFNLGSYKTGSTSVDVAVKKMRMKSCKVGWGGRAGSVAAFDGGAIHEYQKCPVSTPGEECPGPGASPVRDAQFECDVLGDAPWPFAWPTAMRAFPNAKFILSRQKTCKDWVYHVRGLWNAGSGHSTSSTCWCVFLPPRHGRTRLPSPSLVSPTSPPTPPPPTTTTPPPFNFQPTRIRPRTYVCAPCRYDSPGPKYRGPDFWHDRCVETERAIVMTAQKLKLPLLVLHATGPRSEGKMQALSKFLGKEVDPAMPYPHVKTPSAHWEKTDKPPPEDELDPNEDLWGDWSGGVPTGSHTWAKDLKLTSDPDKKTGAITSAKDRKATSGPTKTSAEKAAGMDADMLCPGHPHILRSSEACHEEPVRSAQKRLATKIEEPTEEDEPEWLRGYKQPA